ncbi:MAG: MATE family efflux transporter [Firmicutes bacterium]|nr:MATE family efflux transporter [Bacillota bacterium]
MESKNTVTVRKQFIKYVSLNILSMMGTSCYILADTFFIANGVGADGLTALNVAISLYNFMFSIALMIGIGGATRFAVCKSRSDADHANKVYTHTVLTGLAVGLAITVFGNLFLPQIAAFLGAKGVIHSLTVKYMRVIFGFTPFIILNQVMVAFIRNDGNPKLATIAMLVSNASNIVLDYIFIYPFGWGMFGAALATAVSPVISLAILSIHFIRKRNSFHLRKTRFSIRTAADFCKLGTSSMVNELSVGLVVMIFNFLFFDLGGNTAVAAYGVVANCAIVGTAIFTGIAQGVQPLVSHAYGKGDLLQQKQILRYAAVTAIALAVVLVGSIFAADDPIVSIFNKEKDPLLQSIATGGLCIYFVSYLASCFNIVFAGYLSAMERADFGFIISLMRGLVVIAPMAFLLSRFFGMTGIWVAVPAAEVITLIAALMMIRKALRT